MADLLAVMPKAHRPGVMPQENTRGSVKRTLKYRRTKDLTLSKSAIH